MTTFLGLLDFCSDASVGGSWAQEWPVTTESGSRWKTLGKIIGGVVVLIGLVTACIQLGTALINRHEAKPTPTPSRGSKTPHTRGVPSPSPSPSVPVTAPTTSTGFIPVADWQKRTVTVDASGVRITNFGIVPADNPDAYDVLYTSGGDNPGWQENGNNSDLGDIFYWRAAGPGTPNPAACYRESKSMDVHSAAGEAKPGDQYCYVDTHGVVGYLVVTKINAGAVTTVAWLWNKSGSAE